MVDYLIDLISENSLITLKKIRSKLLVRHPDLHNIALSTIDGKLDGRMYTLKNVVIDEPRNRNSDRIKNERRECANWLIDEDVRENLIFVGEIGVNLWTRKRSTLK